MTDPKTSLTSPLRDAILATPLDGPGHDVVVAPAAVAETLASLGLAELRTSAPGTRRYYVLTDAGRAAHARLSSPGRADRIRITFTWSETTTHEATLSLTELRILLSNDAYHDLDPDRDLDPDSLDLTELVGEMRGALAEQLDERGQRIAIQDSRITEVMVDEAPVDPVDPVDCERTRTQLPVAAMTGEPGTEPTDHQQTQTELTPADHLVAAMRGQALADEVADHLAGCVWVTVWHGDRETSDDVRRITALVDKAVSLNKSWPECVMRWQGGNDYTGVLFGPVPGAPAPDVLADELARFAADIAPTHPAQEAGTWWHITRSAPSAGPPAR